MKTIRPHDVAIKVTSDFDWNGYVDAFDWVSLHEPGSMDTYGHSPVFKDCYRLLSVYLPLTSEDLEAIRKKCGNSFFYHPSYRLFFKLIDDKLFVFDDNSESCINIIRLEPAAGGYVTVEILENAAVLNLLEPYNAAAYFAEYLSDLLPSSRFDIIDRHDWDKGFCWKEAGDPEYEPSTKVFRSEDIAVLPVSEVDWNCLLDSIDWPGLYRICESHYFRFCRDWDFKIAKDSYRLVGLDLVVTTRDMDAIRSVCEKSCSEENYYGHVYQMTGPLLVMVEEREDCSHKTVIRFEQSKTGWRAVEFLEETITLKFEEPLTAAAEIAGLLCGFVGGRHRFGWIDEDDHNQGCYWRDAGTFLTSPAC